MKNLLIGDSHFMFPCAPSPVIASFINQYDICAVPGLPCDDRFLKDKLEEYRAARVIFWSCGHPLFGVRRWQEIRQKQALPMAERLLVYQGSDRYMFKRAYYGQITPEQSWGLFERYLEMVDYWLGEYGNLVLVPLLLWVAPEFYPLPASLGQGAQREMILERYGGRRVDLSEIDGRDNRNFLDEQGHLSMRGYELLVGCLKRALPDSKTPNRE
ncbi:MAG: hypothetical protein SW833_02670 [Cyanobacteriota bacterium]|nr:hypothetical protein [Cyanobacteriota bacterium]